jgi:DNA-binding NtrC family response regulator
MHCQVEAAGDAIYLTDLGSRNTTLVNGRPVQRCVLHPGDEIGIGNVRLLVADASVKAPEVRRENRPGSTVSIRQSSGFYIRGKRADFLTSGKAHTMYDLADLYSLSRALWTAGSQQDIVNRSAEWIANRFAPSHIWHVSNARGVIAINEVFCAPDGQPADPPLKHCERTIQSQDGLLIPIGAATVPAEDRETLIVAPLIVGPSTIGAIAVQSHPKRNAFDETDLELVLAVGCIAAPWFRAMAALESLHEETDRLRKVRPETPVLIGSSHAMEDVREAIRRAAQSELNVLVVGETGSGKEIAARMVHDLSAHHNAPFIAVNCAAIPKDLFESELFGYEKGAFTGAARGKKGLLDECHGGTLFLDEVGDLSPENQARLLRAIETHAFRRLGGSEEHRVDFRVVSATNAPLNRVIHERSFRSDLYYRLNAIEIMMPPLREHLSDIPELAEHFLRLARLNAKRPLKGITPEALDALMKREWPGNIRELKTAIERAAALAPDEMIRPENVTESPSYYGIRTFPTLAELEKRHILEAIERAQGRMTDAARLLGIGRTTLYEKLARLNQ